MPTGYQQAKVGFLKLSTSARHNVIAVMDCNELEKAVKLARANPDPAHKDTPSVVVWMNTEDVRGILEGKRIGTDMNLVDPTQRRK